jgi:hypothetical protein
MYVMYTYIYVCIHICMLYIYDIYVIYIYICYREQQGGGRKENKGGSFDFSVIDRSTDANMKETFNMDTDTDLYNGGEKRISTDIGKFLIPDMNDELQVEVVRERGERTNPIRLGMKSREGGVHAPDLVDTGRDDTSVSVIDAASNLANKLGALKNELGDLDDAHAQIMRQLLLSRGEGRTDVMGLAMALRATRLQHAALHPLYIKQQLAVETLQIWAPLSFQVGLSAQIPELEIHSYVLLFPSSFGIFINWYGTFRPIAKSLIGSFRSALEKRFKRDSVMPLLSDGVIIQSRLKTPPSAFKKMIKSAKRRQQLHDMIGLRMIISQKKADDIDGTGQQELADEEAAVWRAYSIVCSSLSAGGSRYVYIHVNRYICITLSIGCIRTDIRKF